MLADAQTKTEVENYITQFMNSYKNRDLEGLLALLPQDDDIYMFGTGIDEKRAGIKEVKFQAERDWSQTDELDFRLKPLHISTAGPVAWLAAEGQGKGKAGGQSFEFPLRMTAVLEKRNGKWLMVQGHISLPAPSEEPGSSVPV